jgi:hypothetical protein
MHKLAVLLWYLLPRFAAVWLFDRVPLPSWAVPSLFGRLVGSSGEKVEQ